MTQEKNTKTVATFAMSGDLGDIIYSLRTAKTVNDPESIYYLVNRRYTKPWTMDRLDAIVPLMEAQPYIGKVIFGEPDDEPIYSFTEFRRGGVPRNTTLADVHANWVNVKVPEKFEPWLFVNNRRPEFEDKVVVHRSPRYHNNRFPWREIGEKYGDKIVAVGLPNEHAALEAMLGRRVPLVETKSYLDCAEIIASCALFIGNQSSPMAMAIGLGTPFIQEVCTKAADCIYEGVNGYYGCESYVVADNEVIGKDCRDKYLLPDNIVPPTGWIFGDIIKSNSLNMAANTLRRIHGYNITVDEARNMIRRATTAKVVSTPGMGSYDRRCSIIRKAETISPEFGVTTRFLMRKMIDSIKIVGIVDANGNTIEPTNAEDGCNGTPGQQEQNCDEPTTYSKV